MRTSVLKPEQFADSLSERLKQPLPGREAQLRMAHPLRLEELERYKPRPTAKKAGVAALVFAEGEKMKITLIARTVNPRDKHSGQISFPGGRIEDTDANIEEGTMRELFEEVGVASHQVRMLGPLTELYIPVSQYLVHPFLVYADARPDFVKQDGEVIDILTPDLHYFLNRDNVQRKDIQIGQDFILQNVPYYDVHGHVLWGATAMIIGELTELIRQV